MLYKVLHVHFWGVFILEIVNKQVNFYPQTVSSQLNRSQVYQTIIIIQTRVHWYIASLYFSLIKQKIITCFQQEQNSKHKPNTNDEVHTQVGQNKIRNKMKGQLKKNRSPLMSKTSTSKQAQRFSRQRLIHAIANTAKSPKL